MVYIIYIMYLSLAKDLRALSTIIICAILQIDGGILQALSSTICGKLAI